MGTSSCPRGSGLGLCAWLGGGWLGRRGSPERVHGERRRAVERLSLRLEQGGTGLIGDEHAGGGPGLAVKASSAT
jgi:hypothetical protein